MTSHFSESFSLTHSVSAQYGMFAISESSAKSVKSCKTNSIRQPKKSAAHDKYLLPTKEI